MKEIANKSGLYVVGCALVVIIAVGFGILPLNRSLAEVKKQAQDKTAEAESLEKKVSVLKSIQKSLNSDVKRKQQLEIAAPTETKLDEIFIMLETMAVESGVTIDNIQPAQKSDTASNGLNDITITVKGEFGNLINFSKLVKGNLRPMFVKTITFSAQESKDDKTTLSATYALKVLTASQSSAKETTTTPGGATDAESSAGASSGAPGMTPPAAASAGT